MAKTYYARYGISKEECDRYESRCRADSVMRRWLGVAAKKEAPEIADWIVNSVVSGRKYEDLRSRCGLPATAREFKRLRIATFAEIKRMMAEVHGRSITET